MKNKRDSGTALFLMEMIAVVCFFILCASVCILVFVRANNLSRLARDTNQASLAAESVAEIWKAEAEDGLAARFHMSRDGDAGVIYWDSQWNVTEEEILTGYAAIVNLETKEHTEEAQIQILRSEDKTELFLLTVKRIPDR
ncbi:MAG: hypothetical protein HFG78_13160 [Hungatella sp.]|nr:hypothetical protein [Hungatella sp.]